MKAEATTIELYEKFKQKIGGEEAKLLIEYIDSRITREVATKADIAEMKSDTKADIAELRLELKLEIERLERRFTIYFLILLFVILATNPKLLEILGTLLGIVK